ncbi:MAG: hypothetical protein HYX76_15285 [Acidobacteria bacterium]|nr:hypothetical protein [Acidobacteriota bacterium]
MLTIAALGMLGYGVYAVVTAVGDLFGALVLEIWVDLAQVFFGITLVLGAALVRAVVPGGLALAIGALLALQALSIHNAAHLYGNVDPVPQVARGLFAATLVLLAYLGSRQRVDRTGERRSG